eukprot:9611369-Alexandrium_andersonii.AAC.1
MRLAWECPPRVQSETDGNKHCNPKMRYIFVNVLSCSCPDLRLSCLFARSAPAPSASFKIASAACKADQRAFEVEA